MRILLVVLLFAFTACEQQTPPVAMALTDEAKQVIVDEVQAASDRMIMVAESLDGEGLISLLSDHSDFTFASNGTRLATKKTVVDDVIPGWSTSLKAQDLDITESTISVLSKDAALQSVSGTFTETQHDGTVNPPYKMAGTFVWERTDAGWQMMHIHQSFTPMEQPGE